MRVTLSNIQEKTPIETKHSITPALASKELKPFTPSNASISNWRWPTRGQVVHAFSPNIGGNRGLDISGQLGQPIIATAAGKVVYVGSGLPGYGNLIIIKHNENELSAYAHNQDLLVKESQNVQAGQMIAHMGKTTDGSTILHFEIRKGGKPVDPLPYLTQT